MDASKTAGVVSRVPSKTLEWLLEGDNPAVATLTRRTLLGEPASAALDALWARRNEYEPVARVLDAMRPDGSWDTPSRDYAKYGGSLWQIVFLGELHADPADERLARAIEYAFSRQLDDGSWSATNRRPAGSLPCLTANVARGLAAMGRERDERVVRAVGYVSDAFREYGFLPCPAGGLAYSLNGYCHMLAPKVLLLLGAIPSEAWPEGATDLRDEAVRVLRDKRVFDCLPNGARAFADLVYSAAAAERAEIRARYIAENVPFTYGPKPGWLRFGFPLSYNSDALEALVALKSVGETWREEYAPALGIVEAAADSNMRWSMRNTFNGRMIADVEAKGAPSKWLTLRALQVLDHFAPPGA